MSITRMSEHYSVPRAAATGAADLTVVSVPRIDVGVDASPCCQAPVAWRVCMMPISAIEVAARWAAPVAAAPGTDMRAAPATVAHTLPDTFSHVLTTEISDVDKTH